MTIRSEQWLLATLWLLNKIIQRTPENADKRGIQSIVRTLEYAPPQNTTRV